MPTSSSAKFPLVIATSVIRSAYQGQSHGGVYLVDLVAEEAVQVLDWNHSGIDWAGRGGDRGLRGIAFHQDRILLAASDEVLVYDPQFRPIAAVGQNPYLRHCHEITVFDDMLWLTSAGFDSVLGYDLRSRAYTAGYELRYRHFGKVVRGLKRRLQGEIAGGLPHLRPTFRVFDPMEDDGPEFGDTTHLNSVTARPDGIYFSGRQVQHLYRVQQDELNEVASIPEGTHNAQLLDEDRIIVNDTLGDCLRVMDRDGGVLMESAVPSYPLESLLSRDLAGDSARQAFGRGLAIWGGRYAIAGSSPATVAVHDLEDGKTVAQVNLTMDVRNAIHGLEVWPFGRHTVS